MELCGQLDSRLPTNKESKKELDKLSSMILQDYGVKVMMSKTTGLLRAMSKDGKVISEETKD